MKKVFKVLGLTLMFLLLYYTAQAQTWKELLDQADSLYQVAKYDSAIVMCEMALEKTEMEFTKNDTAVASVLYLLGICYGNRAKYAEAESTLNRALVIRKKALGVNHPDVANTQNNLGILYLEQAKYSEAESLLKQGIAILKVALGPEDPEVAKSLNSLARLYGKQGRPAEAESLWKQDLAILKKVLGPDHPEVAKTLNYLSFLYYQIGRYAEAEALYKQALTINKKALAPDHPDVATNLTGLAILYREQAKYAEAESLIKQALAIREKTLGPNHPDVARTLTSMANSYFDQGRYSETELLYKRVLMLFKKAYGPNHPDVALALHNLATLYDCQGKYTEAEPLYEQALDTWKKLLGPDHPNIAMSLNNLAIYYCDQGRYVEAEPLLEQALAIWKKTLGPNHPLVANVLNGLADFYRDQGKYAEAELLYKQSLAMRKKAIGPDHPDVGFNLHDLANLYHYQGKYVEAESLLRQALAIREKALGPDHPYVARSINTLANVYRDQGKYSEAEPLYESALSINEKTLGTNHSYTAEVLHGMALLFKEKGEFNESKKSVKTAYHIRRQNFRDGSAILSERDALTYSKFMRDEACQYISILFDSEDTSISCRKEIAGVVFSTKGQVSDGIFARHRTQVYEKDPDLKVLVDSLRYAKFKLSSLRVQGPAQENVEGYREQMLEISERKERLEAELARKSVDFRRELELWEIDADKVADALPPRVILVEYMKFDHLLTGRETEPHYLLVAVDKKADVFVSDLGPSDQIDSLVELYRSHLQKVSKRGGSPIPADLEDYKNIAGKFYERIWKPVENKLRDGNLIFMAPDGELNLVSFAGLTDKEGKYLIEKYPIHYLSSGRDLVRLKREFKPGTGLFALGDPDFDATAQARASSEPTLHQVQGLDNSIHMLRNISSGCEELNTITVMRLPGTRKEIERISEVWERKTQEPCWVYLGTEATEGNFKTNASGKKVIHLATHGYYAQSECLPKLPGKKSRMMEEFVGENPLLLSGLFLAGSNLHGEGADSLGLEDGILTAEEVTAMDLDGTKWVVLSACESGLGQVKVGEGVYGLRRAFQMAGARTVISALWPVSDKATAEMMSYLYGFEEKNLASAMQSLAKKRLTELRKRNQPDHPYLWAPFIALGDWR